MGQYNIEILRGDLLGGLVAGIVALPLALAFGVQSDLGAAAGLYGAIAAGILAALFGGTATQVTGPTGPMTVVSASIVSIAVARAGNVDNGLGIILLTFFLAGVFQILFGILGFAKYVKYFPYPVISGFMSGVGLIIVVLQIWPFLGSSSPSSTIEVFTNIAEPLASINWSAVGVGTLTVLVFYLFPHLTKAVPSALVALLAGTLASVLLNLDVPTIGDIPSGLPALQIGEMFAVSSSDYFIVIEFALILAVLGSIDSLLTSVIADNITKTKHDSRRELIGQGIGNMAAALIGGIPGAGATKGTVVNIDAGGKTRLSGTFHGLFLLVILLGAGQYTSAVPLSVLAGILIPIGLGIMDYKALRHLRYVPRADAVVLIAVLFVTIFGSLIEAVGIGIVLASVLYMKRSSDLAETITSVDTLASATNDQAFADDTFLAEVDSKVYVKHLYGPMFFGFTARFQELVQSLDEDIDALIIRMDRVPHMDQSGLYAMEDALLDLTRRNVKVLLTGVHTQPMDMLLRIDIVPALIPEEHIFNSFKESIAWVKVNLPEATT
ncbi:MAG: sodium-independent anion transporter [Anaerolineaceae bacterium]|nr:sodium-independent anion transporter [Anaerolineaceae bacterium]MAU11719.1 sodium-independent anion transporter [Anaerolineaceae bacterium]